NDASAVHPALRNPSPGVRQGALIALDQMPDGNLTPRDVLPLLDPGNPDLRRAALAVATAHPEWAGSMADNLRRRLLAAPSGPDGRAGLDGVRQQLLAFAGDPAIRALISQALSRKAAPAAIRSLLLEVVAATLPDDWPTEWTAAVTR